MQIDCAFPGGNIIVERVEGDSACVHQDLRDTEGDWFYFYFRVSQAAGRTVTIHFTQSAIIGVRGPAVSFDAGSSWHWLGAEHVQENKSFSCAIPADCADARFSFGMPYLESHLRAFLKQYSGDTRLTQTTLCQTQKGRAAELLAIPCAHPRALVLLTCRHHCCEMMASYALEGVIQTALSACECGAWLRNNLKLCCVPFVDKDGVEDGDQGKSRKPHDHNRDYADEHSLYPTVRAIKELVRKRKPELPLLFLDLHCPWIRGNHNEDIYFVGGLDEPIWKRVGAFSSALERVRRGPLPFSPAANLPFGQAWNTYSGELKTGARWMSEQPNVLLASTIEIPYANASGAIVDANSARAFGADLACALQQYLSTDLNA